MPDASDAILYEPGATLGDLDVDRRHRVRLPGWSLVKLIRTASGRLRPGAGEAR